MQTEDLTATSTRRWNLDKVGIGLSSACILHCIATPIAISLLPTIGLSFGSNTELFHILMAAILVPVAGVAFVSGYRKHREIKAAALGFIGVLILVLTIFIPETSLALVGHLTLNIVGSLFLISGHFLNRRYCKQCECHHHHHYQHHHHHGRH
jgi:hypothetical protein